MRSVGFVLGGCMLLLGSSPVYSDACSDLEAAITKAAVLRSEMQREAGPFLSSGQMPARDEKACSASQKLRDHIVVAIKLIDEKCVNDERLRAIAGNLNASMTEANSNIGLFCN